ncbi:unnamed protein product [Lymnaea stagnalis]|uniref:Uncharacterized protein n=1 Tax=Lymnaea stagnalis TaxID=6523 RepID=A0AAV2HDJ9_LYMST
MTKNLNFCADGKIENLMERIQIQGESFYKDIGRKTWRVPPVKFNVMKVLPDKSVSPHSKILDVPPQTDKETNKAENIVCGAFESLSDHLIKESGESAMFIVSNFEYDNYLNKLDLSSLAADDAENSVPNSHGSDGCGEHTGSSIRLPKDVAQRGELDILILNQSAGMLLVQTKAVGYNFPKAAQLDDVYIKNLDTAIDKAIKQLLRDESVMLHVMEDLELTSRQMTKLIALPKLRRDYLNQFCSKCERFKNLLLETKLSLDVNFLCEEDFTLDSLLNWWTQRLLLKTERIKLESMKQIAYRTVGLVSTVSVWSFVQPRMEVRNLNDAAWETGNRFAQVLLSSQQAALLKREEKYFYVWGPAGSGKTLLLSLKGRQWLRNDFDVAILNTRLGSKGRTVGHVMESTVNNSRDEIFSRCKGTFKKAKRIDIDLVVDEATLRLEMDKCVGRNEKIRFLIDEVTWIPESEKLMFVLKDMFPDSTIWCAGMLAECKPQGFESEGLESILRCPPSVQRVLRIVDNRKKRCKLYHLESSSAGLPTDGPKPHFIIHSEHGPPNVQPYDCIHCANQLSDFLLNDLNMKESLNFCGSHQSSSCVKEEKADSIIEAPQVGQQPESDIQSPQVGHQPESNLQSPPNGLHVCDQERTLQKPGIPVKQATGPKNKRSRVSSNPSSNECNNGCRLHFNDAVLAVSMPQSWHHYTPLGYWAISREALHSNMLLLGSGPFCTQLLDRGVPLKVEGAMTFTPESKSEQSFAMCPIGSVHGLEYKVVVCIPSARDLPETTELNEGIIEGKRGPLVTYRRLPFAQTIIKKRQDELILGPNFCTCFLPGSQALQHPRKSEDSCQGNVGPKSDKIRISTHVHGNYVNNQPTDLLYEQVIEGSPSTVDPNQQKTPASTEKITTDMVQEANSDSTYHSPEKCLERLKEKVCGHCNTDKCVCKFFRPVELVALHRLDPWDKAYVLMSASRCTSQLILVLP